MQTKYPLRIQVVRSASQKPRLYVNIPLALAAATGMLPGEEVEWELLTRGELHLVRSDVPKPRARRPARR